MAIAEAAGALATVLFLYQSLESALDSENQTEVTKLQNQINYLQNKYNLSQDQIENEIERRGISNDAIQTVLRGSSRAGVGYAKALEAQKAYQSDVNVLNKKAIENQTIFNKRSAYLEQQQLAAQKNTLTNKVKGVIKSVL